MMLLSLIVMFALVTVAGAAGTRGDAGAVRRVVPHAPARVPRDLGRAAARGRRRADRRRGRHRRAGRQGVRAGTTRTATVWSTPRSGCTAHGCGPPGCRPATSRCSRRSRPWRRSRSSSSAACSPSTAASPSARSSRSRPTSASSSRPARQLAAVLTVGQQARAGAERIFQLIDLQARDRRRAGRASNCRRAWRRPLRRRPLRLRRRHRCWTGCRCTSRPASGSRSSVPAAAASRRSARCCRASTIRRPDGCCIDGQDVRTATLHSRAAAVGVAFEESFLFSDTIRANIAYGRPDGDGRPRSRPRRAPHRCDGFVHDLPDGYDTVVGERGLTLSGGQRQRVALARAILADPAVLVLDDATSAVDARTEEAIHDALRDVLAEPHDVADRAPRVDAASGRPHRRARPRSHRRRGHARRADRDAARTTAGCCPGSKTNRCAQAGDRIEGLAELTADGVTRDAWHRPADRRARHRPTTRQPRHRSAAASAAAAGGGRRPHRDTATARAGRGIAAGAGQRRASTWRPRVRTSTRSDYIALLRRFRRPLLARSGTRRHRRDRRDRRAVPGEDRRRLGRHARRPKSVLFAAAGAHTSASR